ncbi:hypothetical protein GCM10029978_073760 [Actinoallomurus acanthiterrae]
MSWLRRRTRAAGSLPVNSGPGRSTFWWMLGAAFAVVAAIAITTPWLLHEADRALTATDRARARIDAVRTGLAAGAGVGAAAGLLLAFRRQQHQERVSALSDMDAIERRITDLYAKAADQLGSDQAAVRLAGLYALERVAQDNPQMRQTVIDVLCAYLRMPYTSGHEETDPSASRTDSISEHHRRYKAAETNRAIEAHVPVDAPIDTSGEKQVRLTAQRILTKHLRYNSKRAHAIQTAFWPNIGIDLSGAALVDFDFQDCVVGDARFEGTDFWGITSFEDATFASEANFRNATFDGPARFATIKFSSNVEFGRAMFRSDVGFADAIFSGHATFGNATFTGDVWFEMATFSRRAEFKDAKFSGLAGFGNVKFCGRAAFESARFARMAGFGGAAFYDIAGFRYTTFSSTARFDCTTFTRSAAFGSATFSGNADFADATFSGDAWFEHATFSGDAIFDGARFSGLAGFGGTTFSGGAEFVCVRFSSSASFGNTTFSIKPSFHAAISAYQDRKQPEDIRPSSWPTGWSVQQDGELQYTTP